ncbi:DUF1007 family protein [Marinomonas sp. C1424]|uniref:DUF1007 family protein n=2 Tax=Marinomonas transparens TaxID=2795388 RepID=A0A934JRU7_9GAMM|nr:DUF1007 family protein [Marinomonas transparens]
MRHLVFLCLSLLWASNVLAHPHVWVDSQYRVKVDEPSIERMEATWGLDLFTSTSLIAEYDLDSDGEFTGQEKVEMVEVLKSFENYGYFIKMKQDGTDITPKAVDVLDVRIRDQMIWIRLGIELPSAIDLTTSRLSFAFGDDELYFAMVPLEEGLMRLSGRWSEACTPVSREAEEVSVEEWVDLSCKA